MRIRIGIGIPSPAKPPVASGPPPIDSFIVVDDDDFIQVDGSDFIEVT
jgi:hypothetical protein